MVYFIHSGELNAVKIGHSDDPEKRLQSFRTGNPGSLILLATIDGGAYEEGRLHKIFEHLRLQGRREWFHCTAELLLHIDYITGDKLWEETMFLGDDDYFYLQDEDIPAF